MKTVFITGASSGIGYATALAFLKRGYAVFAGYNKNERGILDLCDSFDASSGGVVYPIKIDVSSKTSVNEAFKTIFNKTNKIDALINNAGVSFVALLQDTTEEDYDRIFNVNMKGAFLTVKSVLPSMIERKYGKIVNVSSMWGERGASCEVVYSASKAALIGFTKALAKEVGPSGINVNAVLPGVIKTPMNSAFTEKDMQELADSTSLGRIGTPEEIAEVVYYLCSDEARFITGQAIAADGGFIG